MKNLKAYQLRGLQFLAPCIIASMIMGCTYVPIHVPRGVDELQNGDKMTVKTTEGETFVLSIEKTNPEEVTGYKDLELDLHVLPVSSIEEMYPVRVKERLKIHAENGDVTRMRVLNLENNNILGIGKTKPAGSKKYGHRQNYLIPYSDIEKIERLTFTTFHSGFMVHF